MRRLDISSLIYEDDIPGVGDKDNIINMSNNAKETGKTQMLYLLWKSEIIPLVFLVSKSVL